MLTERELDDAIRGLKELPYLKGPFSSRNWGSKFHSMVSYQSKLKPAIAFFLSQLFAKQGEAVFEPFSGVGTISFELGRKGVDTVSLDVNEIAYFTTYAKMNPIEHDVVGRQIKTLEKHLDENEVPEELDDYPDDYVRKFYHDKTLEEILLAIDFFRRNKGLEYSLLKACILHILHGNRPYALSRRSHNITPYAPTGEFQYKSLVKSLKQKVERVFSEPWPPGFQRGEVLLGSILKFNKYVNFFDSVITSPPFVNSTRFLYNNRIRLWFLGQSYQEQVKRSDDFLENKNIEAYGNFLPVLNKALKDFGICVMHLGIVKELNMAERISEMADKYGFQTVVIINEDVSRTEKFGIRDQGATHAHQFLVMRKTEPL